MRKPLHLSSWLPLATMLLTACATSSLDTRPAVAVTQKEATTCENPGADRCVVLACDGEDEGCGIFDCGDVDPEAVAQASFAPGIELARARPPMRGPTPFRNWRRMGLREGAQPKMTFHFRYRHGYLPAFPRYTGPVVKHHLLPQAQEFRLWFKQAGVDIHQYTIIIPEHHHQQIHRPGGRGGRWNDAWRDYTLANPDPPPPEVVIRYAFALAVRFDLVGPVVPYSHPIMPLGPQLFSNSP